MTQLQPLKALIQSVRPVMQISESMGLKFNYLYGG